MLNCGKTQGFYKIHVTNPKEQKSLVIQVQKREMKTHILICPSTLPEIRIYILGLRFPLCEKSSL